MNVFRYWSGPNDPPMARQQEGIIRSFYPDATIIDLPPQAGDPRTVSNAMRAQALYDHGGLYLDHDVIPLAPLPPGMWIAAHGNTVCTCAIQLPAGAPFALACRSGEREANAYIPAFSDVKRIQLRFDMAGRLLDPQSPLVHLRLSGSH